MKVKIGPYPDYKWYHNYLFELFGYTPEQTVNVKLDKWDTWSMDHTLAKIVLPVMVGRWRCESREGRWMRCLYIWVCSSNDKREGT